MEEQIADNSDNDSVESWTLINKKLKTDPGSTAHSADQTDGAGIQIRAKKHGEDDTDTDGISVISDEELDTAEAVPEDANVQEINVSSSTDQPNVFTIPCDDLPNAPPLMVKKDVPDFDYNCVRDEELSEEFFTIGGKHRSYIHKRNNKLSTILNMILIGTIVTTACLAVGHIWGTTDDCSPEMYDSISELLYNMQELQHENYILKAKIKLLESNKKARPNYLPLYVPQKNPEIIQTEEFLKQEKSDCLCNDQFKEDTPEETNSSDYKSQSFAQVNISPVLEDNLVSFTFETMNESINNDEEETPSEFIPGTEFTKRKYKRSISGTSQNAHVGPKEYNEYLLKESHKHKRAKNLYDLNGNISEEYSKKHYKGGKKKYNKFSEEFENIKSDEKKHKRYKMYKMNEKDNRNNEGKYIKIKKLENYSPELIKEKMEYIQKKHKDYNNEDNSQQKIKYRRLLPPAEYIKKQQRRALEKEYKIRANY